MATVFWIAISLAVNVITMLALLVLLVLYFNATNEVNFCRQEWSKWERRWYETQGLLSEMDIKLFATMGKFGNMLIKDERENKHESN
jgi:hypothetical protein